MKPITGQVEIVRQVKLKPRAKLTLVQMSNDGGRYTGYTMDWSIREELRQFHLIEERPRYTKQDLVERHRKTAEQWRKLARAVKARNVREAHRAADELVSGVYDSESKAWWLTKAAEEYLLKGKVTKSFLPKCANSGTNGTAS
jgi:hypothetical protein